MLQCLRLRRSEKCEFGDGGEVGGGEVVIVEYERSPRMPSYRAVSAVNPLPTGEDTPPDDITPTTNEGAEPVSIDDKESETSDDLQ